MSLAPCHGRVGLTTSDETPGQEGWVGQGAGLALGLGQLSEVGPSRRADGGLCELELRSPSSVGRSRGIKQLGFESFPNHLASVTAGPTREIKTCSSSWKDRQCTICRGALPNSRNRTSLAWYFFYSLYLMHCSYLTLTCQHLQHDMMSIKSALQMHFWANQTLRA